MSATSPGPSRANRDPSRAGALALPIFQLVAVCAVGVYLLVQLQSLDADMCLNVPQATPGIGFVLTGVAGLIVGRYIGAIRFFTSHPNSHLSNRDLASVLVGRIALAVIFLALIPIFVYEAVGVYEPAGGYEPITYYVRCSIWIDNNVGHGIWTIVILASVGLLYGQWLWSWHPGRGRRDAGETSHAS
jgi:hypothetical protein